jgi:hypothetical protein
MYELALAPALDIRMLPVLAPGEVFKSTVYGMVALSVPLAFPET